MRLWVSEYSYRPRGICHDGLLSSVRIFLTHRLWQKGPNGEKGAEGVLHKKSIRDFAIILHLCSTVHYISRERDSVGKPFTIANH